MKKEIRKKDIAIVGFAGRFHDSENVREFWENLVQGKELVQFFDENELIEKGVDTAKINHPDYVPVESIVEKAESFDYEFFGYTKEEANEMDPQIRMMHELAWTALEDAGCNPDTYTGKVGAFLAASEHINWIAHTAMKTSEVVNPFYQSRLRNKDFISSLISYSLNLKGPSYHTSTACSSSLVSAHIACRSLLLRECSVALAGGVSLSTENHTGYMYKEGAIASKDGHSRSFDEKSSGCVKANGGAVVVLKRMEDAIKDNDHIYAIIRGTATNNDGKEKAGYTAPSVEGQANCIKLAQKFGNVPHDSISYIEAHGTATHLGDAIEVSALNKAFENDTAHSCAIGSLKSNVGHLDVVAGVAGLMKASLALKNKKIPATLHFETPNSLIDFESGPFKVNTTLTNWLAKDETPLRAGVSSFGVGGTNAHVILEEFEADKTATSKKSFQVYPLSAKSETALENYQTTFTDFLQNTNENSADVAYTLATGRKGFAKRSFIVADTNNQTVCATSNEVQTAKENAEVVFVFTGEANQYTDILKEICTEETFIKEIIENGVEIVARLTGKDHKEIIDGANYAQSISFLTEFALAKYLLHIGVQPRQLIGKGYGELTAACVAEVCSLEDGLKILTKRTESSNTSFSLEEELKHIETQESTIPFGSSVTENEATILVEVGISEKQINSVQTLRETIGKLWSYGVQIDWNTYYENETRCKVSVPTYQFDYNVLDFKVDPFANMFSGVISEETAQPFENWFYHKSWKKSVLATNTKFDTKNGVLLFSEKNSLSSVLKNNLITENQNVFEVFRGVRFENFEKLQFGILHEEAPDYVQLFNALTVENIACGHIIYNWSFEGNTKEEITAALMPLLHICKALVSYKTDTKKKLTIVADFGNNVIGSESQNVLATTVATIGNILADENTNILTQVIDISVEKTNPDNLRVICDELNYNTSDNTVAYRNNQRWVQCYENLQVVNKPNTSIEAEKTYLITEGLSTVGSILATHLIKKYNAKVVLIGKEILPKEDTWAKYAEEDSATAKKINTLIKLKNESKSVSYYASDLSNLETFTETISKIEADKGNISGVIHTSENREKEAFKTIENIDETSIQTQLGVTIEETANLTEIFANKSLDFLWMQSSLSTVVGGVSKGIEATTNQFIDASAQQNENWVSVNLDEFENNRISDAQIANIFEQTLHYKLVQQCIVSIKNPNAILKAKNSQKEAVKVIDQKAITRKENYKPPKTETEQSLVKVWEDFLGFDNISIIENFFELGGDSLKAMTLIKRIHKHYHVDISLLDFFSKPTIQELAVEIDIALELHKTTIENEKRTNSIKI